jgi:small GTP-binding protein
MEILKIAITGNVGAGKTSFIKSISEIEVVSTERRATDETGSIKENTTVAMDFGRLTLNENQAVQLYGTPGQFRFDFMWEIVIDKADAYILLVDGHRPEDFRNCRRILNFMKQRVDIPMIIGMTHMDCEGAWQPENIAIALGTIDLSTRPLMVTVNAGDRQSVAQCLLALLEQMLPGATIQQEITISN